MFSINSLLVKISVTCIKLLVNKILIGIGGHLYIFNISRKSLLQTIKVFEGQDIYGIELNSSKTRCIVHGGNKLKIYACNLKDDKIEFKNVSSVNCNDWVLTAKWINDDENIITVLMHNNIILWTATLQFSKCIRCKEKCLLYSAHIVNTTWDELIVLAGTVFSDILIWGPAKMINEECPVLHRLTGHQGAIFSIDYNPDVGIICSTSDDRSAKVWCVAHKNLLTQNPQTKMDIKLKFSLFGHDARVFRCKVLDNYVLTAGEDSLVNIWNVEGKLIRTFMAHQGACVWSIDANEQNNQIITGGGNSGVTLFPLKYNVLFKELLLSKDVILKKVAILRNNDVVTVTEMGVLKYYRIQIGNWSDIANHNDLKSYVLLEVSPCRTRVALAGFYGTIHIYELDGNNLHCLCSHEIVEKSRIFALHWLSNSHIIVCGCKGIFFLYTLEGAYLKRLRTMKLPASKERWTTAACFCMDEYIAVGDRKGNIYLYSKTEETPVQIIKRAHNYLGITNLYYKQRTLISLGRNSIVKKYYFNTELKQFDQISSDKLPFAWLASLYETEECSLLLSFLGDEFIVWDYKTRRILLQLPCGGGHRSWDFYATNGNANFVFIKDRTIITSNFQLPSLHPIDFIDGYHLNEVNTLLCFKPPHFDHQCLIISGGEDTTLRVSKLSYKNKVIDFSAIQVLKSHLSSIRVITACKILESCTTSRYLLFSGGGRAQIIMWELSIDEFDCSIKEKYSYYERIEDTESETRIMDACSILTNGWLILITACSDGSLKIFSVDIENSKTMMVVGKLVYKLKCILKVSYLRVCDHHIILSMATDGKIVFWDFTQFINMFKNVDIKNEELLLNIKPVSAITVHQSGINSFTYRILSSNLIIFLSGGDDNAIIMNLLSFTVQDESIKVKTLSKFEDVSSHCAQITGVYLLKEHFLTVSGDQSLNIFKWNIVENQINCVHLQKYNLSVPDIKGFQCYEESTDIYAIVYGNGIEFCQFKTCNEDEVS